MQFLKALLVGSAALFSMVVAQEEQLAFTVVPSSVVAGQEAIVEYSGNLNAATTIRLRRGDPGDLDILETLTTTATGGEFRWTPETSLENGDDYALEIIQGEQSNFSGLISVSGGTGEPTETEDNISTLASDISSTESATETESASQTETESASTVTEVTSTITSVVQTTLTASNSSMTSIGNTTVTTRTRTSTASRTDSETTRRTGASQTAEETSAPTQSGAATEISGNLALVFGAAAAFAYLL